MVGKTVVEFQHSDFSEKNFKERNLFYDNLGYKVVWLFDMSNQVASGNLHYQENSERDNTLLFSWKKPKRAFDCYDVKTGHIDLFFQISDSEKCIVRVIDVSDSGFGSFTTTALMTKDDFLAYVGLSDSTCAAPYRESDEENRRYTDFSNQYSIQLNSQQERALQTVDGSVLLLAVPGSGKTTTLVARLGFMILVKGIPGSRILAVSFGRDSTAEIKSRFHRKFGTKCGKEIHFSTINSLAYSICRRYLESKGNRMWPTIEDKEKKKLLTDYYQEINGEYPAEGDVTRVSTAICYVKNKRLTDEQIDEIEVVPKFKEIYERYQRELRESLYKMDFDDQLCYALTILKKKDNHILETLREQYDYICVDEAQDTSKIQHEIIHLLAEGKNLFMVGDEDQSIYGFRGAYPEALLNFRFDYKNPFILLMEKNYRSTEQIVNLAQRFISRNTGRYEKHMCPDRGPGSEVKLIPCKSREDQFTNLVSIAKEATEETAFLYRNNESSVVLIDLLRRNGISFGFRKSELNFFRISAVSQVLAYLSLTLNQYDSDALKAVSNKGILFLRKEQLDYALRDIKNNHVTVFDALDNQMEYNKKEYKGRAKDFRTFISSLAGKPPMDAIALIEKKANSQKPVWQEDADESIEVLKILAKYEATIESFVSHIKDLEAFIMAGTNTGPDNRIVLSTIHSSKGLEYDNVYLFDLYDGRFPSAEPNLFCSNKDSTDAEQEERRLFYVGITRAKESLSLLYIENKHCSYIEELFPEISKARINRETVMSQLNSIGRQAYDLRTGNLKRTNLAKKAKALADEYCAKQVAEIIDNQDKIARDILGRRWIKCTQCGTIKLEEDFVYYGGNNNLNLGICRACARH